MTQAGRGGHLTRWLPRLRGREKAIPAPNESAVPQSPREHAVRRPPETRAGA